MNHVKKAPLRTCIPCGVRASKKDLTRIVAVAEDAAEVDSTGKSPGRGAYVCADGECIDSGLKRGRFEHALRIKLTEESWDKLLVSLTQLHEPD